MTILHLGKYYYPYVGGIESHLQLLCNELRAHYPVEVLVCNSSFNSVREEVDGIDVTRCSEMIHLASTSICPTMPFALSKRKYQIIHLHFPHPMGVMSYLASSKPKDHRLVITYHSDIVRQQKLLKLYAPFMKRVMARADAIICTSQNYIDSSDILKEFRNKCRVVPLGIDLSQFEYNAQYAQEAQQIRAKYAGPILLAVGRLIYYKGFEYMIEAMCNIDAQLLIIGEGPLHDSLLQKINLLGLQNKVHLLGEIKSQSLASYYYACDMLLFPSTARSEAFGIVQMEAMACGKPVINTSLETGVPFVSRHRETGLTVPPKDSRALTEAINELLGNERLLKEYGQAAKERVHREFSKELMAQRVIDIYQELMR